ncbi:MAG: hypothetical protein QOD99_25 [Chthoniobacter sp.]|nr:hypothetical protein [Chthoniobacter sp.]
MNCVPLRWWSVVCASLVISLAGTVQAGAPAPDFKNDKNVAVREETFPGSITIGGRFSNHLTDGYIDLLLPAWASSNQILAFSSRAQLNDHDQDVYSFGAVWRYLVPDRDLIFGLNGFYDYLESQYGNHFDQLGLGAEILSKWVDARFNYYLPDDSNYNLSTHHRVRDTDTSHRTVTRNGLPFRETTTVTTFERTRFREAGLAGFYTEAGVLVPGLDHYFELRLFAGYYHYNNPFGHDFRGFEARAEAQLLQGVTADISYYDDKYFMGGHWIAGIRVSVPFEIGNIFRGKNPFEGAGDSFRPGQREFRSRMGEMVLRSPRIKTVTGKDTDTTDKTKTTLKPLPTPAPVSHPESPEFGEGISL